MKTPNTFTVPPNQMSFGPSCMSLLSVNFSQEEKGNHAQTLVRRMTQIAPSSKDLSR